MEFVNLRSRQLPFNAGGKPSQLANTLPLKHLPVACFKGIDSAKTASG